MTPQSAPDHPSVCLHWRRVLEREYQLVKSYDLYVSPDLYPLKSRLTSPRAHFVRAAVYRRR
jgi:hypothetical protein